MRYTISILFVAMTFLVGCQKRSQPQTQTTATPVATQPTFQPMIISSFGTGTNTLTDGALQMAVSETTLQLSRPGSSVGFPAWIAQKGWFVFIESDSRVWAYDGDNLLLLITVTTNGNGVGWRNYSSPKFPCAVPSDVFSRLSPTAQRAISPHD